MLVIGLMSGTSADGVDAALTEIEGDFPDIRVRLLEFICLPHPPALRREILSLCTPEGGRTDRICALNAALGEVFAGAAFRVAQEAGIPIESVDLIGSHGQTIWHQPEPVEVGELRARGTLQIGEPSVIAGRTGGPVIADFRPADMAAGGQGAPLVPFADYLLFRHPRKGRAVQNIGGIANATFIPANSDPEAVLAFDTGPGNMVIDALVSHFTGGKEIYDREGEWAARGQVLPDLLARWLEHPFFTASPPKTTGREQFGAGFVKKILEESPDAAPEDLIATAAALTAESIASAYRRWIFPQGSLHEIILGGGGIYNRTLRKMLEDCLSPVPLKTHGDFGLSDRAKEVVAFALLAYATANGIPGNLPSATGASRPVILGKIIPGRNWPSRWIIR